MVLGLLLVTWAATALAEGANGELDAGATRFLMPQDTLVAGESQVAALPETNSAAAEALPHDDLGRDEAAQLLHAVFEEPLDAPAGIFEDLDVAQFHSDYAAVVDRETNPGQQRSLLQSLLPLRVGEGNDGENVVDLDLVPSSDGGLEPSNPLVDLAVPAELGEGLALPESAIKLRLVGAPAERAPSIVDGAAFFPNVAQDSDLTVVPTPAGVETFAHLRTPDAPLTQTYDFILPARAVLEARPDGGAEVSRDGRTLGVVQPPTAIDAEGDAVPVTLAVDDDSIVVTSKPDPGAAFPILVDPVVETYFWSQNNNQDGLGTDWVSASNSPLFKAQSYGYGGAEKGLNIYSYAGTVQSGAQANWNYHVPRYYSDFNTYGTRPSSFITSMSLTNMNWWLENESPPYKDNPYVIAGIWDEANNWFVNYAVRKGSQGQFFNASTTLSNPNENVGVKEGGVALHAEADAQSRNRHLWVGQATVEVSDKDFPKFASGSGPGKWINGITVDNTNLAEPISFEASDLGLGVYAVLAKAPKLGGGANQWEQTPGCPGNAQVTCPRIWKGGYWNYNPKQMPQGENVVEVNAKDPIWHLSDQVGLQKLVKVKVDRMKPTLSLSGTLTEQSKLGTGLAQYTLKYDGADGDSAAPSALTPSGTPGTGEGQTQRPMGVAVDASGNLWMVDRDCKCIQKYDPTGKFLFQFGAPGTGNGQFTDPRAIAISPDDLTIWVSDNAADNVQAFTPGGQFVRKITYPGFVEPYGVGIGADGRVWVADVGADKVFQFTYLGAYLRSYDEQMVDPIGIATDPSGNAWVVEHAGRITGLPPNGGHRILRFGTEGSGDGQLKQPVGVAVSPAGNVVVVDSGNGRVQEFKPDGRYIRQFGSTGTADNQLSEPRGIALGAGNIAYIADANNKRIARWGHAAYDPQSGVASTEVKIDGTPVEPKHAPGCATKDCAISREWMLNSDQISVGQHTLEVTATDAVGFSTSKSMTIETHGDLAPPAVALSGTMTQQATLGTTRPGYTLKASATDPGSAEERKSGVASTTIKVDGATVDSTSPGCPAGGCSITREWTLNSNSYSVGDHAVQVTATDAAGRVTTKTLTITINRDTTAPEINTTNAFNTLFNRPEGWVEQKTYSYWPFATDANGYGVTSLLVKFDGATVSTKTQSCPKGNCETNTFGSLNMVNYDGGAHTAEVIAIDGAGNTRKKSWTINVDPQGAITVEEAEDTLEAVESTAPEVTEVTPVAGLVSEAVAEDGSNPQLIQADGDLTSVAAPTPSTIYADPQAGFSIESTGLHEENGARQEKVEIAPVGVDPSASDAEITDGSAAVISNYEEHVDTVLRPAYDGLMTFQAIRDQSGSESYSWTVSLAAGESLEEIDEKHAGIFWDDGTQAMLIAAEAAHGADGSSVPTTLAVSDGNVITLMVHHRTAGTVYPVVAGVGWEGGFQTVQSEIVDPSEGANKLALEQKVFSSTFVGAPEIVPSSETEGGASASGVKERRRKWGRSICGRDARKLEEGMPGAANYLFGLCGNSFKPEKAHEEKIGIIWRGTMRGMFFYRFGSKARHTNNKACAKDTPTESEIAEYAMKDDHECHYGPKTDDGNGGASVNAGHYLRAQAHWEKGYRGKCAMRPCHSFDPPIESPWVWEDVALEYHLWPTGNIEKNVGTEWPELP
jgi:sugar lactone lactonase YvrE